MLVESRMQKNLITLNPYQSLKEAGRLMKDHHIRHLPVVDSNQYLVGIVTDRDVRKASASDVTTLDIHELSYLLDKITVERIMTKTVETILPSTSLKEAAKMLHERKLGCLPVVENQKLVGIITTDDILKYFVESMADESPQVSKSAVAVG